MCILLREVLQVLILYYIELIYMIPLASLLVEEMMRALFAET